MLLGILQVHLSSVTRLLKELKKKKKITDETLRGFQGSVLKNIQNFFSI